MTNVDWNMDNIRISGILHLKHKNASMHGKNWSKKNCL